jgi:hypothetical protein
MKNDIIISKFCEKSLKITIILLIILIITIIIMN